LFLLTEHGFQSTVISEKKVNSQVILTHCEEFCDSQKFSQVLKEFKISVSGFGQNRT